MTSDRLPSNAVVLYWIPLGAGGSGFVRFNGRVYEALKARLERRPARDLYHTALEVRIDRERFVIETMWPSPAGDPRLRGVVVGGPVFAKPLSVIRTFRYEVRCWRDGVLPDADQAVSGPQLISGDPATARRILDLAATVPSLTWGRDQIGAGDMWNSNSVISWLITRAGIPTAAIVAPGLGRAPGWSAGIVSAMSHRRARSQTA